MGIYLCNGLPHDTHTFLWFSSGSKELSERAKSIIADGENEVYISIASLWEISIKVSIGKLSMACEYREVIDDVVGNAIQILPISFEHTALQNELPLIHRDPFDRIIASQCIGEGLSLIGCDIIFDAYFEGKSIKRIW